MSYNYTTDTQTIVINSIFRTSGDRNDAYIPMGNRLNNKFKLYHCKVISCHMNSYQTASTTRMINLEAFDFMEQSYGTNDKYNSQIVANGIESHPANQYNKRFNMSYIVKNFNNETKRFIVTDIGLGREKAGVISGARHWTLILALTPIYDEGYKLYKVVSDKKLQSFTYAFIGKSENEIINLPPIYDGYSRYFVQVRDCRVTTDNFDSAGVQEYSIVTAEGWARNPSQDSDTMVVCCLADHQYHTPFYGANVSGDNNPVFIIDNMKQTRPIRFKLLDGSFDLVDPARILAGFEYMITCLITPID